MRYRYNTLEDFLVSTTLTVDGQIDDGWGAPVTVKGRELDATILFADISRFSERTRELSPTETLIFVNHFFSWLTAEALQKSHGIVDKYIGDEIMIVFSREFGSDDPFEEAVKAARWMGQNDAFAFMPHIGIASGRVIVGYVGTPVKYSCSVFGAPVVLAARCAVVKPEDEKGNDFLSCSIVFPAREWGGRDLNKILPRERVRDPDGSIYEAPQDWRLREPRKAKVKASSYEVREIVKTSMWCPPELPEERAKEAARMIQTKRLGSTEGPSPSTEVRNEDR
jgi:hypothetical protein